MRFEFDTNDMTSRDVLLLSAIASTLSLAGLHTNRAPEATVGDNGASGTTVQSSPSEATGASLAATGEPTEQGEGSPALVTTDVTTDTSTKPARTRRTKAQIEADNLAAEAAARQGKTPTVLSQSQQDAVDDTAGILTPEQKTAIAGAVAGTSDATVTLSTEQVAKIVDLDALRAALQTYTAKHDLAAGIALLGLFECKRISEVLALPADRQQAFLLACNV